VLHAIREASDGSVGRVHDASTKAYHAALQAIDSLAHQLLPDSFEMRVSSSRIVRRDTARALRTSWRSRRRPRPPVTAFHRL